jgi:hypothetical protein
VAKFSVALQGFNGGYWDDGSASAKAADGSIHGFRRLVAALLVRRIADGAFSVRSLDLISEPRPHLGHLQRGRLGLFVCCRSRDFQAARRKQAIFLGAPHTTDSFHRL